jgi:hypothetical protein
MQPRRSLRLVAGALVLALPLLSSCGFGKATEKVYTPGVGTNDRNGDVDVLAAVVVAAQPNEGTFVVSLANNLSKDEAALSGVSGPNLEFGEFEPIEIDPRGLVNLAQDGGITVTGDFDAGDVLPLTLTFASGDTATLNVPVVTACDEYLGLDVTKDSEFIPYDCDFEAPPAGGEESE